MLLICEDIFDRRFKPMKHPEACHEVWGGLGIETYGDDWALVKRLDPERIWTVVDSDEDYRQWILPGIHHVNRVVYLYTRHRHYFAPIEVEVEDLSSSSDTPDLLLQAKDVDRLLRRTRRACR
ncbi:hypothetical protein [Polycyclovorans algicola]|uniref:hypothetical protein n=1 Tax=Polycyclovorans algicola TaxID=616992 RepID=UPI000693445E|nr:hypothetical protein [Polycyclovorans algicola]